MTSFIIFVFFARYYLGDKVEGNGMSRVFCTDVKDGEIRTKFYSEDQKGD